MFVFISKEANQTAKWRCLSLWMVIFFCTTTVSEGENIGNDSKVVQAWFSPDTLKLETSQNSSFTISFSGALTDPVFCYWSYDRNDLIAHLPNFTLAPSDKLNESKHLDIQTLGHAGTLTLGIESDPEKIVNSKRVSLVVQLVHSIALATFSDVVGWIYFVAWSISFYPQVISNYKRKSVAGLSFDFLALNITGFLCYTIFNVGLFWVPAIQDQYYSRHPRGVIPVEANDVFFAIHAVTLTLVQIIQCFIYETGNQRLFKGTILLLGAIWLATIILLILSTTHVLLWLDYLYYFSYVKLGITLIKYMPQVWMNFRRKSTVGWSVGNVLLDFTGGMLSLAQMFIIAYNFDDWSSTLGNPTKIGLGLLSIFFDVIFMVQHYCLYRKRHHDLVSSYEEDAVSAPSDDPLIKDI